MDQPLERTRPVLPAFKALALAVLLMVITGLLAVGIRQALGENTIGADFYTFWRAGRALIFEDRSPYSEDLTHEIQLAINGRLAAPQEDQLQFSYPLHVLVAILPLLPVAFDWAQALWMAANLVFVVAVVMTVFPGTPPWMVATLPLFYNILYAAGLGNFSLPISMSLLLFFAYFMLQKGTSLPVQVLAGLLLAWTTAKPQSVWLFLLFALAFCYRQRLWLLLRTFAIALSVWLIGSFLLRPDWLAEWLSNLVTYAGFTWQNRAIMALPALFLPRPYPAELVNGAYWLAFAILVPAAFLLLAQWWRGRVSDFNCLTGAAMITYLLQPQNSSGDQLFLLLPVFLWFFGNSQAHGFVRWLWLFFVLYSYLLFFASALHWASAAIISGQLVFFFAWFALRRWVWQQPSPTPVTS